MSRMEYQVVTTFTPSGQLHRTEQFARRQCREASPLAAPPSRLPRSRALQDSGRQR